MGLLIGLLAPKLGKTGASLLAYGGLVLIVFLGLLAWGHAKYNAGVKDTDAKYAAASAKLHEQAVQAVGAADAPAAVRVQVFAEKQAQEKERIDAAEANNSSTFDVLFGPGGV